ncbi:MAG: type III pantothenate kinase [Planctomycetales bacterium]|nr:type III pantothenate kinase [Planctomycetales bacterium]
MNTSIPSRLLAVDVGNSRIKFGLFDLATAAGDLPELIESMAVAPDGPVPWAEMGGWPGEFEICSSSIVAASNPDVRDMLVSGWPDGWSRPCVLDDVDRLPLKVRLEEPSRTGIDRLLNAVAANRLATDNRPLIIVDSGTATTVDAVDADGVFLGGAILPGFGLLARSLQRYTTLLPLVTLEELGTGPPPVVGGDTTAAIKSGLFYGQLGAVRELAAALGDTLGDKEAEMFLTGGGGPLLASALPEARLVPHLGLHGLAEVFRVDTSEMSP